MLAQEYSNKKERKSVPNISLFLSSHSAQSSASFLIVKIGIRVVEIKQI